MQVEPYPYASIIIDLLRSIQRAQRDVILYRRATSGFSVPAALINRHFIWIGYVYREPTNRHLVDGVGPNINPLRTEATRSISGMPPWVVGTFEAALSLPVALGDERFDEVWQNEVTSLRALEAEAYIQKSDTRISRLVLE